ncbi:amino acid ABC transporter substrate-binding protein [Mesorhizobium loti]|nr:ABC transporter substrate-binding protein [Mesorhizobium loti]PLP60107.1 amino acid ABC transporter substrate-binding protein [Mesorhizobium loti]
MISWKTVFASLLSVGLAFPSTARSLSEIRETGKIVIATEAYFAPFAFFEGDKLTGFEVEIANAIATQMGLKTEWVNVGFDALLVGLQQDRWDWVVASMTSTPERLKAATWVAPHYCSGMVAVGKPEAVTEAGMKGKVAATLTGSVYVDRANQLGFFSSVTNFPQDTNARMAVMTGRADIWLTDSLVALQAIKANPEAGLAISPVLIQDQVASAVKKDELELSAAISDALAQIVTNGTYAQISKRWFDADISCK